MEAKRRQQAEQSDRNDRDRQERDKQAENERLAKIEVQRIENERLTKVENDRFAAANAQKQRDRQAMQNRVNGYLNTALAAIGSKDKDDALSDLNNALRVAGLPTAAKIAINEAKAAVASADWNDAKTAITKAAGALK